MMRGGAPCENASPPPRSVYERPLFEHRERGAVIEGVDAEDLGRFARIADLEPLWRRVRIQMVEHTFRERSVAVIREHAASRPRRYRDDVARNLARRHDVTLCGL